MLSEISGGRFDAVTILLGHLTAGGLGGGRLGALQPETLETFAPWHALFYCGFVVTAGWSAALPIVVARDPRPVERWSGFSILGGRLASVMMLGLCERSRW